MDLFYRRAIIIKPKRMIEENSEVVQSKKMVIYFSSTLCSYAYSRSNILFILILNI